MAMSELQRESATYDPDLPHEFMRPLDESNECMLCSRLRKDELHQISAVHAGRENAREVLARELGTPSS